MNIEHPSVRPKGFTDLRYFYYTITGKTEGRCIVCKKPTDWNEETGKYNRFCNNPKCKEKYKEEFQKRMISRYGKTTRMDEPDFQRKLLEVKHISGKYKFSDGGEVPYVGSYEKDFLMMLDRLLNYRSTDIMSPSPHTYYYMYDGKKHFYIPDFFIPNLELEIEVKQNTSKHPKILAVDKVKEKLKDQVMIENPKINYLKIVDKNYEPMIQYLLNLKDSIPNRDMDRSDESKTKMIQESLTHSYIEKKEAFESIINLIDQTDEIAIENVNGTLTDTRPYREPFATPAPEPEYDPINVTSSMNLKPGALLKSDNYVKAMLPCVMDEVSGEPSDGINLPPINVNKFVDDSSASGNVEIEPTDRDHALKKAENIIKRFDLFSVVSRKRKVIELQNLISKWNLVIDLTKYPKIMRTIKILNEMKK